MKTDGRHWWFGGSTKKYAFINWLFCTGLVFFYKFCALCNVSAYERWKLHLAHFLTSIMRADCTDSITGNCRGARTPLSHPERLSKITQLSRKEDDSLCFLPTEFAWLFVSFLVYSPLGSLRCILFLSSSCNCHRQRYDSWGKEEPGTQNIYFKCTCCSWRLGNFTEIYAAVTKHSA